MSRQTKRPSAVVAAEKAAKQQEKEDKERALEDSVKTLSRLEDQMAEQDKENDSNANRPPILTKPKAIRSVKKAVEGEIVPA
jgi:hypothetical protein